MRLAWLLPLAAGLGCAASSPEALGWREHLPSALREAESLSRPLLVVSVLGDLRGRC